MGLTVEKAARRASSFGRNEIRRKEGTIHMTLRLATATLLVMACHARGTDPHAMGAGEHDAQAEHETKLANEDDAEARAVPAVRCDRARFGPCWSEQHARASAHHRDLAARHRAASAALREAESTACVGIEEVDRATSPLLHAADIRSVVPIEESFSKVKDRASSRLVGARIVFHALPGMTAEWMQRAVDCHLARNAAIGHARAREDMPDCPLTLGIVDARAWSSADGVVVTITSEDPAIATEILRRAQALVDIDSSRGPRDGRR